jgi:hypothetical protein
VSLGLLVFSRGSGIVGRGRERIKFLTPFRRLTIESPSVIFPLRP